MEPGCIILGPSAATAACLASDDNIRVQDVDDEILRQPLVADGQVVSN